MASLKESVLIPLSLFQRCTFSDYGGPKLPHPLEQYGTVPEERIKIYEQHRLQRLAQRQQLSKVDKGSEYIKKPVLDRVTPNKRPEANNILDFILQHKLKINWDPRTMEVMINGQILPDSDIGSILQRLTSTRVVNISERVPPGTWEVYNLLVHELGMPENWISTRLQLRTSSRRPNKTSSWIGLA